MSTTGKLPPQRPTFIVKEFVIDLEGHSLAILATAAVEVETWLQPAQLQSSVVVHHQWGGEREREVSE